jgi:hypothetical protein
MDVDVSMYVVNQAGSDPALEALVTASTLPTFQDFWGLDVWEMHDGGKDDFYIYNGSGKLAAYFKGYASPTSDLSTDEGYGNLKEAILNAQ